MACNCCQSDCDICNSCTPPNPCDPCTSSAPPLMCHDDCDLPIYTNNGCFPEQKTSCITYDGVEDTCVPIPVNTNFNTALSNLITYIKNSRSRLIPDSSINIELIDDACDDKANISLNISEDAGNLLELRANGVYCSEGSGSAATPITTNNLNKSVLITATGLHNHTLSAEVVRDTVTNGGNNVLQVGPAGVYVPPVVIPNITADNGLTENIPNNVQLGGNLLKDTTISNDDYSLTILPDLWVGMQHPGVSSSQVPKFYAIKYITDPVNEPSTTCGISELFMFNLGQPTNTDRYSGAAGVLTFDPTTDQNYSSIIGNSYSGVNGHGYINSDFDSDFFISGFYNSLSLSSKTVGAYTTHGKLSKYAGLRLTGPRKVQSLITREHGGVEDSYGVYIESMKGTIPERTDRSWGIYQTDAGDNNYLASTLKIGSSSTISPSAKVQIDSTTQGFLPPRMTAVQAEAISSKAEGLMVYASDGSGSVITSKGWWGWDNSTWVKLG